MDYRILQRAGDRRVYDIVVDGISLVHSYREQFTKIIRTHSYEELVAKLRQNTGEIKPFAEAANP